MKDTWFDKVESFDSIADFSRIVLWFRDGEEVKRMRVSPSMKGPYCPACLMWRAQLVPMTDYKRFNGVWDRPENPGTPLYDTFTKLQCPECKGLSDDQGCTCGEAPHQVKCPMGFMLYFQNEVFPCL
jgi:hypothetical protein